MGSNTSKVIHDPNCSVEKHTENEIGDSFDPRSPTPEIVRTPLHNKAGSKHNITKNADLRKTFEGTNGDDKLIHNNPILSAVIKNQLQFYDPRSPTQEFERTPIVINDKDGKPQDKNLMRIQNTNDCGSPCLNITDHKDIVNDKIISDCVVPKKLCDNFYNMTMDDSLKQVDETPLGSSTASSDSIENNVSNETDEEKGKQFLETNFDYVEGDKSTPSPSQDQKEDKIESIKPQFKILELDPRSPSVGIERTPIVVAKPEDTSDNNVEEMSDDSLIKVLQNTNSELRLTSSNKNCEGLLIYEDDADPNINDTPKKSKSASNSGSRTPLSCMKNKGESIHIRSKSANTLYDPKTMKMFPSKIPKRVSHIPRLKALNKQIELASTCNSASSLKSISKAAVISGDCENTPPNSHRDCWDKNNSIVL